MGGITGVFGAAPGLGGGDTSGPVEIELNIPVAVTSGGTGAQNAPAARANLFLFTPTNAAGDMYYRATTGTPGTLARLPIPGSSVGHVLTINPSNLPAWMAPSGGTGPGPGGIANPLEEDIVGAGKNIIGLNQLQASVVRLVNGPTTGDLTVTSGGVLHFNGAAVGGGNIVTTFNGLHGAVTLAGGTNITLTPSGNTITIDATGGSSGITSVFGRSTAAIVAEANDYTAEQVTNAVRTDMPGGYTDPAWLTINWAGIAGKPSTFQPVAHTHSGADITSGIIATQYLGTGTHDTTHFLRGDGAWAVPPTGSPGTGGPQTPWESHIDANQFNLGNVNRIGIGTLSPAVALHIASEAEAPLYAQVLIDPGSTGPGTTSVVLRSTRLSTQQDWLFGTGSGFPDSNNFRIQNATAGVEVLNIAPTTNFVGINRTNPVFRLDVNGDINASGTFRINGQDLLSIVGVANPWTEDVDADRWNLLHVGQVSTQYLTFCNDTDPALHVQMLNGRLNVGGAVNATAYFQNGAVFSNPWVTDTAYNSGIIYNAGNIGIGTLVAPVRISTGPSLAPIKISTYNWNTPANTCTGIGVISLPKHPVPALTFGFDIDPIDGTPQMVLAEGGRLGIGTLNPTARLTVVDEINPATGISSRRYGDDTVGSILYMSKARGTEGTPASVQTGDYIGY